MSQRMGGFQCRDNSLQPCQEVKGLNCFGVVHRHVSRQIFIGEIAVLRAHTRIIQPG